MTAPRPFKDPHDDGWVNADKPDLMDEQAQRLADQLRADQGRRYVPGDEQVPVESYNRIVEGVIDAEGKVNDPSDDVIQTTVQRVNLPPVRRR